MSGKHPRLDDVLTALAAERLLPDDWRASATEALAQLETTPPWYVRFMVGAGAWLASLLLIVFVTGINLLTSDAAFIVTGLLLVAAAVLVRRAADSDFLSQAALACSLAGQALLAYGVSSVANWDETQVVCVTLITVNGVLLAVYPDFLHRILSVLIGIGSLVGLIYLQKQHWLLAWLAPALAGIWLTLLLDDGRRIAISAEVSDSIVAGLLIGAFGVVMLSTIYLFPELVGDFVFYPRPWVSTLVFGVLLILSIHVLLAPALTNTRRTVTMALYLLALGVTLAAWHAPGLIYALIVILVGAGLGRKLMLATGLGFMVVFLGAFFYGIDTSMLTKSTALVGTGLVLLGGRQALLGVWPKL